MIILDPYQIGTLTDILSDTYQRVYYKDSVSMDIEDFEKSFSNIIRNEFWLKFLEETSSLNSFTTSIRFFESRVYQTGEPHDSYRFYKRYFICWNLEDDSNKQDIPFHYQIQIRDLLD